jgi:predicted nucleic acid-binding protein
MNIVVDTNIVFSAVLNSTGKIGDLLMNSNGVLQFFGCDFLKEELLEHHEKLKKISKLSDAELQFSKEQIFSKITFIDTRILPIAILLQAEELVAQIDPDDTEHIALSLYLECRLWSGDKRLREGLRVNGLLWVLNTDEMLELRATLQT